MTSLRSGVAAGKERCSIVFHYHMCLLHSGAASKLPCSLNEDVFLISPSVKVLVLLAEGGRPGRQAGSVACLSTEKGLTRIGGQRVQTLRNMAEAQEVWVLHDGRGFLAGDGN